MNDPYPHDIEIEIDRAGLCRYLRLQAILVLSGLLSLPGFMCGGLIATAGNNRVNINNLADHFGRFFIGTGLGVLAGVLLAFIVYLIRHHFSSKKIAAALHVSVEGQFLRVTEGFLHRRDRKLHFRAIVDYTCYQGPLMRYCGITGIAMTTTAGGQGALLNVLAVQDATKIRDLLSEIDRLREDEKPG